MYILKCITGQNTSVLQRGGGEAGARSGEGGGAAGARGAVRTGGGVIFGQRSIRASLAPR